MGEGAWYRCAISQTGAGAGVSWRSSLMVAMAVLAVLSACSSGPSGGDAAVEPPEATPSSVVSSSTAGSVATTNRLGPTRLLAEAMADFSVIDVEFHQLSARDPIQLGIRTFAGEDVEAVDAAATKAVGSQADEVYAYECSFGQTAYQTTQRFVDGDAWRDSASEARVLAGFRLGPADLGMFPGCVGHFVVEGVSDAELARLEEAVAALTPHYVGIVGEDCWNDHTDEGYPLPDPATSVPEYFVRNPPGTIRRCDTD